MNKCHWPYFFLSVTAEGYAYRNQRKFTEDIDWSYAGESHMNDAWWQNENNGSRCSAQECSLDGLQAERSLPFM